MDKERTKYPYQEFDMEDLAGEAWGGHSLPGWLIQSFKFGQNKKTGY